MYLAGTRSNPYAIGQPYRHSSKPKPTSIAKSRYFVVTEEMIMPMPMARTIIWIISNGIKNSLGVAFILVVPFRRKKNQIPISNINCIPNDTSLDNAVEIGATNLG